MGTLEPLGNGTPNLLPSLPPSPSEEDLTKADGIWNDEPEPAAKWKGKARELSEVSESAPFSAEEEDPLGSAASEAYPPMNDEDAETRRVEETLRRWEVAERQRRKAARLSQAGASDRPSSSGSVIGDAARRASMLWSLRRSHRPLSGGGGTHAPLHGRASISEDGVRLDDIDDASSPPTPQVHSAAPSPRKLPATRRAADPLSPFDDPEPPSPSSLMSAASDASVSSTASTVRGASSSGAPARPVLEATSSFSSVEPAPPAPFDLPHPRSPPPRGEASHANRPPEPNPPPDARAARQQEDDDDELRVYDGRETRWWTDWLCGCGPSRSNDKQAGRTNPFE